VEGLTMNELEREYLDNVARSKRKDDRPFFIVFYGCSSLVFGLVWMIADGFSVESVMMTLSTLGVALILPALLLAKRFQKWFEDRNVVVMVTEREKGYRAPITMASPEPVSRARHVIASIPLGVVAFASAVVGFSSHRTSLLESFIVVSTVVVLVGIGFAVRAVYRAWRARRNARLEIQWEKWLDSADSCEVGPRKWTK